MFDAALGSGGERGCARGAALVFPLVGVLHEVGYVCAGGVVGGEVGGDEEVGGVEGEGLDYARDRFARGNNAGFAVSSCCLWFRGDDAVEHCFFALEEMASVDHEAREVSCAKRAADDGVDEFPPQPQSGRAEADQIAAGVFAERVVYSAEKAVPEPCIVFGGEVRCVVWELFC